MFKPLIAPALFATFVGMSGENAAGPHVTLEATRSDGSIERIAAQNPDLCNAAIDAWRARIIWTLEDFIRLRCVTGDQFAPGSFAPTPNGVSRHP